MNGIAFANLEHRLTYVNPAFIKMWGYTDASEVLGQHIMHFGASEAQTQKCLDALREHGNWRGESVARKKNGEPFIVEVSTSVVKDVDGNVIGTMGSFSDIADRKRTAEALRASEEQYRSLVESAHDPIFTCDVAGRYLYANMAAAARLGLTPDQVIGKTVDDLFPPEIAQAHRVGIRSVIETGQSHQSASRMEVGGRIYWFSINLQPVRDREGRIVAAQAIVRDITDIKQAEEALRESEERLRQVIRVSNIGIFDHNHETGAVYWSPQQREIWGWGPDESLDDWRSPLKDGKADYLYRIHEDDRQRIADTIARVQNADDGLFDEEYRIIRRDGSVRWVSIRSRTFYKDEGKLRRPTRTIGAMRDITEEKRAEQERANLQTQLADTQRLDSIGRLAGGVAHDFNNMLSVIIGHAELAIRELDAVDPIRPDLDGILKAAHRSAELTRQLLGFARRQTVTPRVLNLNELVTASLKILHRMAGEDLDLVWTPARHLKPVRIDPSQVDQILTNLTVNARDAISGVGRVLIRTENAEVDAAFCQAHTGAVPGVYTMLEVTDNGCGMDDETRAHIFEPFFTTKALGAGTGLGLATVYGIVKQNNGFITVSSRIGQGTTINVFLPSVMEEVPKHGGISAASGPASGAETVLLVEDEPMILELTQEVLERLGYSVLPAATPSQALRLAERHHAEIDLLLTDVTMPEMNGRDLANRLVGRIPDLKCLFMSGYAADSDLLKEVLAQRARFLPKPFTPQDLAATIREMLDT